MTRQRRYPSDIAFTPAVKAIQQRKGSRASYERMEAGRGWSTAITPDLAGFIAAQTSVFLGTASADGQPYIQHRGGPPGFLRVLDERPLGFADYRGNKTWGEARVVENDPRLVQSLMPEGYTARPEQVLLLTVSAWDANRPQHIPQRFEAADVAAALEERDRRIAELTQRLQDLEAAERTGDPG